MDQVKTAKQAFFELVRAAINEKYANDKSFSYITVDYLQAIYSLSKSHDVVNIVASVLEKYNLLGDDEWSQKYQKQLMTSVYRYKRIDYEIKQICSVLESTCVPFLPLKGALIRQFYPEPWMRTSCDIDVLIHSCDDDVAIQALCSAGYNLQPKMTNHDYPLLSPSGVKLELHYTLMNKGDDRVRNMLDAVWQECSPEVAGGYRYKMSNEMFMFYHVAHMANHFVYGGCGIRPFIDLWLLKEKMPVDQQKLDEMFERTGLTAFYNASLSLSEVWLGESEHDGMTSNMENFILTGGVYGSVSNSAAVKSAKGQSKLRTILKLVFIPRADLAIIYPKLKKYPVLYPFYQVKRWFKVFNRDKRRRVATVAAARNAVSQEESDSVKSLLDELHLL